MGLSLHYTAKLRKSEYLPELIEEIIDICQSLNWPCREIDSAEPKSVNPTGTDASEEPANAIRLRGVLFTPPECETFSLLFSPDGRLLDLIKLAAGFAPDAAEQALHVSVKTQFAGPDVHSALVKLLRYLEKKYLADVSVIDEGAYWETEDRQELERRFARIDRGIAVIAEALENYRGPGPADGSPESLADLIERILRGRGDF